MTSRDAPQPSTISHYKKSTTILGEMGIFRNMKRCEKKTRRICRYKWQIWNDLVASAGHRRTIPTRSASEGSPSLALRVGKGLSEMN
jgi:hypothetical protein